MSSDPTSFWNTVAEEAPDLKEKYELRVLEDQNFTLGAFTADQLVGLMSFVRQKLSKLRHKGEIHGVYVHPDQRGNGISSLLLAQTLERAFSLEGLEKVMLTVTDENIAAKSLYEKYGFVAFGLEENGLVVDGKAYGQYWMQITKADWHG